MKKRLIIVLTVGSLLMIFDSLNVAQAMMMFFFTGIIPGTSLSLSPTAMMVIMSSAGIITTTKFIALPIKQRLFEIEKSQNQQSTKTLKHA